LDYRILLLDGPLEPKSLERGETVALFIIASNLEFLQGIDVNGSELGDNLDTPDSVNP
jgi:hypothetical protein